MARSYSQFRHKAEVGHHEFSDAKQAFDCEKLAVNMIKGTATFDHPETPLRIETEANYYRQLAEKINTEVLT